MVCLASGCSSRDKGILRSRSPRMYGSPRVSTHPRRELGLGARGRTKGKFSILIKYGRTCLQTGAECALLGKSPIFSAPGCWLTANIILASWLRSQKYLISIARNHWRLIRDSVVHMDRGRRLWVSHFFQNETDDLGFLSVKKQCTEFRISGRCCDKF